MTEQEAIKALKEPCFCDYDLSATIESCKVSSCDRRDATRMAIQALEEIQQYRAIGTIEEVKVLKEKSIPKKPIDRVACKDGIITVGDVGTCPNCGHIVAEDMFVCEDCLQVLDWEGGE